VVDAEEAPHHDRIWMSMSAEKRRRNRGDSPAVLSVAAGCICEASAQFESVTSLRPFIIAKSCFERVSGLARPTIG
jgi:hypothetical protein